MTQVTNADREWLDVSGWGTTIGDALRREEAGTPEERNAGEA
jgi:hypothetical protein